MDSESSTGILPVLPERQAGSLPYGGPPGRMTPKFSPALHATPPRFSLSGSCPASHCFREAVAHRPETDRPSKGTRAAACFGFGQARFEFVFF